MAVQALPRAQVRQARRLVGVPSVVLAVTLAAPALDMFGMAQPYAAVSWAGVFAAALAAVVLVSYWVRFPRTSWLAAASFAAMTGLALRLLDADLAQLLSLLSIVALGIGGAFATHDQLISAW